MSHVKHVPNRRHLDEAEINELDDIVSEYKAAREVARIALIAAQSAYQAKVTAAADRRDDRILDIIDAVDPADGRGTQARIVEYLRKNSTYLSMRIRKARIRKERNELLKSIAKRFDVPPELMNDESVTPRSKDPLG